MANKHYHQDYAIWPLPFFYWHKNASKEVLCLLRAILPVSSVSFARKNDSEGAPYDGGKTAPLGKTVPVIVLMAMKPALLNSAATMSNLQGEEENPNLITMAEPAQNFEIDDATYVMQPKVEEVQQSDAPYGWKSLTHYKIQKVIPVDSPLLKGHMIFATGGRAESLNEITDVFLIDSSATPAANPYTDPPRIEKIVHHKNPDGKGRIGLYIYMPMMDANGKEIRAMRFEGKIDDNSTKELLNLLNKNTKWQNRTLIDLIEIDSQKNLKTIVYE